MQCVSGSENTGALIVSYILKEPISFNTVFDCILGNHSGSIQVMNLNLCRKEKLPVWSYILTPFNP